MPQHKERQYTIDDIYAMPDGQRAELVDGQLYMMAPPARIHQEFVMELTRVISNHIHENKGSCKVYPAPFAVFLTADNMNYVEPDISVICDLNKLTDKGCCGAPDFIIEIVSPSSRKHDYLTKSSKYEDDAAPIVFPFSQDIAVGIYGDLNINMEELLK